MEATVDLDKLIEVIEERLEVNLIYLIDESKLAKQYKSKMMKEISTKLPILLEGAKSKNINDAYFTRNALQFADLCRRIVLSVNFPKKVGSESSDKCYKNSEEYKETICDLLYLYSIINQPIDLNDNWKDEI